LERQKGFDLLLEAFAGVAAKYPDWTLDIFGRGSRQEALERSVTDLGLVGQVRINAPTDRLGERMRDASVFVLSSRFEGFPLVLLEALTAGLAVVSFDCPTGPGEILTDGTNGLLVAAEDVPAFAAALDRIMADESLQPLIRMVSRIHVVEEARHVRYAREELARQVEQAGPVRLAYSRLVIGRSAMSVVNRLVHPDVYRAVGIDPVAGRAAALANPTFRATLRWAGTKAAEHLSRLGLIQGPARLMWRRASLI
jgi:hypothetical protein